jgi:Ca2+-binding RTX toxin-like protein
VSAASLTATSFLFTAPPGQTFDGTAFWGGTIAGGAGVDTVSYADANYSIYVDLLRDGGYAEGPGGAGAATHLSSIENITGSSTLLNYLHGNQEDNVLIGGDHFDYLVGRGGNNTLDGRGYINMADYYETNAPVTIDLTVGKSFHSTGIDTLINIQQFRATNSPDTFIGDGQDNYFHGMSGDDSINGNGGRDWLDGSSNNDIIDGGDGDDRLIGGPDDDWLTGGSGADLFVYNDLYPSADRILDLNAAEGDRIDFSGLTSVNSFSDLAITSDGEGNARLAYGQNSIVLVGITAAEVNSDLFLF